MKEYLSKLFSLCLILTTLALNISFSVSAQIISGENLLANPGFEDGLAGWTKNGNVAITTAESHTGSNAVLISERTQTYHGPQISCEVEPNTDYYVSVWVKPVSITNNARGTVRLQASDGSVIATPGYIDCPAGEWTKSEVTINTGTNTKVRLYFQTNNVTSVGNADIYLDDFELRKITETPDHSVVENMIDNSGFESGAQKPWIISNADVSIVNDEAKASSGIYAALSENRTTNYGGPQTPQIPLDPDTYYFVSAMVKTVDGESSARMRLQQGSGMTAIAAANVFTDVSSTGYTQVKNTFYNTDAATGKVYVTTNEKSDFVSLYTDDYVLLPITSSIHNGAVDVEPNTDITLTVPEDIEVSLDNIAITGGAEVKNIERIGSVCTISFSGMDYSTEYTLTLTTDLGANPSYTFTTKGTMEIGMTSTPADGSNYVALDENFTFIFSKSITGLDGKITINNDASVKNVKTEDNKKYTVTFDGLEVNNDYTITVSGVIGVNGYAVPDQYIRFRTDVPEEPIVNLIENPGFENTTSAPWGFQGGVDAANHWRIVTNEKRSGEKSVSSIGTADSCQMFQAKIAVIPNQNYLFVFYAKAGTRATVRVREDTTSSMKTLGETIVSESSRWVRYSILFNSGEHNFVRLYIGHNGTGTNYYDDFSLIQYNELSVISSNPENNSEGASLRNGVSITFNNKLKAEQNFRENFAVSEMQIMDAKLSDDGRTVRLTFDTFFKENTNYTVTFSGIEDIFGEILLQEMKIEFKTGGSLGVVQSAKFYRDNSEISTLSPGNITVKAVVENNGTAEREEPVLIVTAYDKNGFMSGVKTTKFNGKLNGGELMELLIEINVSDDTDVVTAHIFESSQNISYMDNPIELRTIND